MALHARTAQRQRTAPRQQPAQGQGPAKARRPAEPGGGRQLSLRVVLLVLAFVPSAAMVGLLADNSGQLYGDWQTAKNRENSVVVHNGTVPTVEIFYALQQERQLSAAALADPKAYQAKLAQARKATDSSATILSSLSGGMPADITASLQQVETGLTKIPAYRAAIDNGTATQQQVFDEYTALVSSDLALFTELSKTGVADIDVKVAPTMLPAWGQEMISREDAIITAGAASGRLTGAQRTEIAQAVGAQEFIYQDEVIPSFPASIAGLYQSLITSATWQQKTAVEQSLLAAPASASTGDTVVPPALGRQWQQVTAALDPRLAQVTQAETGYILASGNQVLDSLRSHLILQTVLGAVGVILVIAFTSWLVGRLRRRISALREAALELETRLPEVVERMRRGEQVDAAAELPELRYGSDELGMLGRALNAARGSALETSVRQVEQYRGFERLLQRIARRTQLLIGLQMKRLSEMERQYEDSAMLEGLFDLDHLTTRLRRYEENLVILGGGQPQRRWRKPVPLLNVLRSAQGEVQDYRRIRIEVRSRVWIAERGVGALVHMLAELMENAVSFSKPPTPVEVTAAPVSRGLAVEIEDRGVGMDEGQYSEINAMMVEPPRMDVLSRADDARLGLYVVARLAASLGVRVELRPSSFGGTRVVVLIPAELVLTEEQLPPSAADDEEVEPGTRLSAIIAAAEAPDEPAAAAIGPAEPAQLGVPEPEPVATAVGSRPAAPDGASGLDPLPRRVRQASLVRQLRAPRGEDGATTPAAADAGADAARDPAPIPPARAGATVGAFQRQSRLARLAADGEPNREEGER